MFTYYFLINAFNADCYIKKHSLISIIERYFIIYFAEYNFNLVYNPEQRTYTECD
jgi:hypothetical protein